jgi:hypothetical protein
MRTIFLLPLAAALGLCAGSCQKEQSEADRQAEIERQVQERLAAEHQAEEHQKLAQREADLSAQEQALKERERRAVATPAPAATAAPTGSTSATEPETGAYATFYRKLDQYGDWMETGDYGFVFQPRAATQTRDWRPYTNGHWVYTDAGWTWISDEPFGWATYHYGRWVRLRNVGWVWVPGDQWAPAWVSWRKGNDYVGWAPLPPEAHFDRQTGIRNWADNYYDIGPEQYCFVPANEFGRKLTPREVVPPERNVTIINQTTNVTNIVYNNSIVIDRGPSYDDLRARSQQPIQRLRLERTQNPEQDRPVIRGQVVALPTVDFRTAERAARPNRVARKIPKPEVERGWSGITDPQAAAKAREKMKADATPPPNLPAKKFVRPEPSPAVSPPPGPVQITPPPAPPAKSSPLSTPPARPILKPSPGTPPTASPDEMVQPTPAGNVVTSKEADRNQLEKQSATRAEEQRKRQEERSARRAQNEKKMQERRERRGEEASSSATPQPSAEPMASASPAAGDAPEDRQRRAREKRQNNKGRGKNAAPPSSSASPTAP